MVDKALYRRLLPIANAGICLFRQSFSCIPVDRYPDLSQRGIPDIRVAAGSSARHETLNIAVYYWAAVSCLLHSAASKMEESLILIRQHKHHLVALATRSILEDFANLLLLVKSGPRKTLPFFVGYAIAERGGALGRRKQLAKALDGALDEAAIKPSEDFLKALKTYARDKGIQYEQVKGGYFDRIRRARELSKEDKKFPAEFFWLVATERVHDTSICECDVVLESERTTVNYNPYHLNYLDAAGWTFLRMLREYDLFLRGTYQADIEELLRRWRPCL